MCAPGTKEWRARRVWMLGLLAIAAHVLAGFMLLQFALAFGVQYEAQWLNQLPEKVYIPEEALVEMECLQTYTEALAAHDIHYSTNAFAAAAFDLAASEPVQLARGLLDWASFLSPAQQHAHSMWSQCPLSWAVVCGAADNYLGQGAVFGNVSQSPPTIWLAARLPGSGKRASRTLRGSGRGGDNGTDPGSASGGASASNRPVRELVGPNASSTSGVLRRPASVLPAVRLRPSAASVRRVVTRSRSAMWQRTYQRLCNWVRCHGGAYPRRTRGLRKRKDWQGL